jgi:hypothetical protein
MSRRNLTAGQFAVAVDRPADIRLICSARRRIRMMTAPRPMRPPRRLPIDLVLAGGSIETIV